MNRRDFFRGIGAPAASVALGPVPEHLFPAYALPAGGTFSNALGFHGAPITAEAIERAMSVIRLSMSQHMSARLAAPCPALLDAAEAKRIEAAVERAMKVDDAPRYAYIPRGQDVLRSKTIHVILMQPPNDFEITS